MNFLQKLSIISIALLTGVVKAEETAAAEDSGTSKLQTAMDITVQEAALAGAIVGDQTKPIVAAGAGLAVAALHFFGVFKHKKPAKS